ncbi:uncharacterized protein LOC109855998 isoform X2 [Pseudomyrmex gracilis]|nr:uncharacterized protein LOC109855998 isoform X2 [Pseudomyrmex gracilis]
MCSGCKLISYCGQDHQKLHWPQHKDLCRAVRYMRETYPSEFSSSEEEKAMMQLVMLKSKVALRLERKLLPYEVQMFKYPKMCLVCKKQNQLENCSTCISVSFCKNHKNNHDKGTCDILRMAFTAYMSLSSVSKPVCVNYINQISEKKVFCNMKEFLSVYEDIIKTSLKPPYKLFKIEQSTNYTKPLTIIHGIQMLKYNPQKKSLVFHVIARNTTDMWCLPCWEIILHLLPNIKSLRFILIGPDRTSLNHKLNLCNTCKQQKKKISVEWLDKSFGDYVEETAFKKPDLIIGFHPGFPRCDIEGNKNIRNKWVPSIQILAKQNCPLILTCYSEYEAKLDVENINLTLGKNIDYLYCERNPFAGYRPYRESDDESQFPVYFENYYLLVYKNLCNNK